jgi:hypothetical protein
LGVAIPPDQGSILEDLYNSRLRPSPTMADHSFQRAQGWNENHEAPLIDYTLYSLHALYCRNHAEAKTLLREPEEMAVVQTHYMQCS